MTTFALVHGAWHASWCWDLLVPELEARGASAVTMDLPAGEPDAAADRYAEAVLAALDQAGVDDDVVLVGHSLGGLTVPVVAERRPVAGLVLLCALVPEPGRSFAETVAERSPLVEGYAAVGESGQTTLADGASAWIPEAAIPVLYQTCDPTLARGAAERLRPQHWTIAGEVTPLRSWPAVPTTSIVATDDQIVDPAYERAAAARIGARVVELAGDHSPMLGCPAHLAEVLLASARPVSD